MEQIFYFLDYTKYKVFASVQKTDFEISMDLHVLRATESKKVSFGMSSVCLSVGTITQKIIELAQSNLVMRSLYDKVLGWDCIRAESAHRWPLP